MPCALQLSIGVFSGMYSRDGTGSRLGQPAPKCCVVRLKPLSRIGHFNQRRADTGCPRRPQCHLIGTRTDGKSILRNSHPDLAVTTRTIGTPAIGVRRPLLISRAGRRSLQCSFGNCRRKCRYSARGLRRVVRSRELTSIHASFVTASGIASSAGIPRR